MCLVMCSYTPHPVHASYRNTNLLSTFSWRHTLVNPCTHGQGNCLEYMGGSLQNTQECSKSLMMFLFVFVLSAPRNNPSPSILMVAVAFVCLAILLLPLEGDSPDWPLYLHISVNQKLIAAFALGKMCQTERESCLLYTSPSPRDATLSRMPSSA